jgi:phosphatidylglycerol---prolipoprotein diacylglyceryl transferase
MVIPYPRIPPTIVSIGPLALRWYSLMYVVGYFVGYRLVLARIKRGLATLTRADLENLIWYLVTGMLIGARIFYVFVYGRGEYSAHPLEALEIWRGGLSFHGAAIGMGIAAVLFARRYKIPFLELADLIVLCGTPGLFFGRIGNFINGELYGRPTNVPWAMIFPGDPQHLPRHPSQLYEAFAEGLLLAGLLWLLDSFLRARRTNRPGVIAGAFLIGYAVMRFSLEFTRQPDAQLGFVAAGLSMGQLLSLIMLAIGVAFVGLALSRRPSRSVSPS